MSQGAALLLLFVVLPFVVAGGVIWFVSWRNGPAPVRTSDVLATGEPGTAEVLAVKTMGGFLDTRPMVKFTLRVTMDAGGEPFDLDVTQSIPRRLISDLGNGDVIVVRVTPDRQAAAIVLGRQED